MIVAERKLSSTKIKGLQADKYFKAKNKNQLFREIYFEADKVNRQKEVKCKLF